MNSLKFKQIAVCSAHFQGDGDDEIYVYGLSEDGEVYLYLHPYWRDKSKPDIIWSKLEINKEN